MNPHKANRIVDLDMTRDFNEVLALLPPLASPLSGNRRSCSVSPLFVVAVVIVYLLPALLRSNYDFHYGTNESRSIIHCHGFL